MKLLASVVLAALPALAQPARPVQEFSTSKGMVKITPVQHASLMIEGGGKVIHVDPTSPGNYEGLPPADFILITDIHPDHMDPKAIAKVQKAGTVIYAPAAVAKTVTAANGDRQRREQDGPRLEDRSDLHVQPEARPVRGQIVPRQRPRERLRADLRRDAFLSLGRHREH